MEYKLILSGPVNKRTVENAVIDWVRKHPQGVMATSGSRGLPSQHMPVPQNRQQQAPAHSPTLAPQRTQPRVYGPPAPAGLEQALSPHIRMRRVSEMGKNQVHTFIYNERELLIVRQGNLHHQWVQLKHSWETTQGLQAVQAVHPNPANLSEWDRLKLAMASGIRQLPGQVVETVQKIIDSLLTWQGMLLIVAVTAIFVVGGEIALLLMGAVAVYDLLMNVLPLLVEFYHKAIAAKDQAEIDAAGKLFAQAILRGGLDVIDILFAGGAVRRLTVLGHGRITARAVWVYLEERIGLLVARLQKGAGKLQQVIREAQEAAAKRKAAGFRGMASFDEFKASVKEFQDPANQRLATEAYDLYKAQKWNELETLFNKNNINGGWPPNRGFIDVSNATLKPGQTFDRYGGWVEPDGTFRDKGTFVSPVDEPFPNRALPDATKNKPYQSYEVVKPLPVKKGKIIPWFGKPGNGTQYELPETIEDLVKAGYIKPKK